MSNFHIDEEIEKLVDKLSDQFKAKLKKMVIRSEKIILKQYIASQKETKTRLSRLSLSKGRNNSSNRSNSNNNSNNNSNRRKKTIPPKREKEYLYDSDDSEYSR